MRCTQLMGLHVDAEEFLNQECAMTANIKCPECGHVISFMRDMKVYASAQHEGMFNDGPNLHEYRLKDGRIAREFVQAAPWSSGPCIFLGLHIIGTDGEIITELGWSDEDIDNC